MAQHSPRLLLIYLQNNIILHQGQHKDQHQGHHQGHHQGEHQSQKPGQHKVHQTNRSTSRATLKTTISKRNNLKTTGLRPHRNQPSYLLYIINDDDLMSKQYQVRNVANDEDNNDRKQGNEL